MLKKIVTTLIAIAVVIAVFIKLASNKEEIDNAASYKESKENVPVEVMSAELSSYLVSFKHSGTLKPIKDVQYGTEGQGKLIEVLVEEGELVKQGQLLARINDELLRTRLIGEQAQLENASIDLERQRKLMTDSATTDAMLRKVELAHAMALTAVTSTQTQLKLTNILAPIDGIITQKNYEIGSIVAPGVVLGTITDISQLKLEVLVPENQINLIKEGTFVEVSSEVFPNQTLKGMVSLIAVKGDQNHNFKVVILVPNNDIELPLRAGMFATVQLASSQQKTDIQIPRSAVVTNDGISKVFVAINGKAVSKIIQINGVVQNKVMIKSGIEIGDHVIFKGVENIKDGVSIKIK